MEYAPLYGLEAVFQVWYSPVPDNIGRIFEKIFIE
jgi:hypothetical protein